MVITVDVEPDDVWRNLQARSLANVPELMRLQALLDGYGARATLLVTSTVVNDGPSRNVLHRLAAESGAEIGSHLHPWETGPFMSSGDDRRFPLYPHELPLALFEAKMERLTEEIARHFPAPTSYRAGRWGLAGGHLPILADLGYEADTSVMPLTDWSRNPGLPLARGGRGGPNHLYAPRSAYHPSQADVARVGQSRILELPVTAGFLRVTPRLVYQHYHRVPRLARRALSKGRLLRPATCVPPREPADELALLVRAALAQSVSHINMTFHSSELLAGGSPRTRTPQQVESVFSRIERVLDVIASNEACRFHTLTSAARYLRRRGELPQATWSHDPTRAAAVGGLAALADSRLQEACKPAEC